MAVDKQVDLKTRNKTSNKSADKMNRKPSLKNLGLDKPVVWSTESAFEQLQRVGEVDTKRTAERRLHDLGVWPDELEAEALVDEFGQAASKLLVPWAIGRARTKRRLVLLIQLHAMADEPNLTFLHANDTRGARYWLPINGSASKIAQSHAIKGLKQIAEFMGKPIAVLAYGRLVELLRGVELPDNIEFAEAVYRPRLSIDMDPQPIAELTPYLKRLEAESIHIIREAVAEATNPVMMHSIGKDSAVMLHLTRKAFYPAPPPFSIMHVDTRWKFQEMYLFRDKIAEISGMKLIVYTNPEAIAKDVNPFDHGTSLYVDITKVDGLKQALDKYKFDVMFGGARRDEEKSRAKERIFSFRSATHRWDPKQQRPELWNLYNTKKKKGESIRVFPLSNWTELDIWQYIYLQNIPVVPLYFAKRRPVVVRDGTILMIDDDRFRLLPGEQIQDKMIRFRSLGCYPLTGAIESTASNLPEIILEVLNAKRSERQGRVVDHESPHGFEKKKQEGHF
jgi:sulfate adenylyltransferase subunit 2